MPKKDYILDLPGFSIKKVSGSNPLILDVTYRRKATCPYCGHRQLRKKDTFLRMVRHENWSAKRILLRFKAHKFYCLSCKKYFHQRFPGILKHQRATEKLKHQVFHQHTRGISQKELAQDFKVGTSTIERWYHQRYQQEYQERKQRPCPTVLGIDEHTFNKKQKYLTTFCDLRKHKVFDVVKGKNHHDLEDYLQQLPEKHRVKVVCMDLSSSYKSLVQKYFPQAKIVADRFHVIRLVNHSCLQTYRSLDPELKYHRGMLLLLRKRLDRLTATQFAKRNAYLERHPVMASIEQFKQLLYQLLMKKHCTAKQCKRLLPLFLHQLKQLNKVPFAPLKTLYKTLTKWQEEIVRMWRFTKSNGITEGFHRKMKLIQRRAYGFRNFENYRLRVSVLCG